MTSLFQNALSILLGLALSAFGVIHAVTGYPGPAVFARLVSELPTLMAVAAFALALAVAAAGLILLGLATRRLRLRGQQARRRPGQLSPPLAAPARGYRDNGYPAHHDADGDPDAWERAGVYR